MAGIRVPVAVVTAGLLSVSSVAGPTWVVAIAPVTGASLASVTSIPDPPGAYQSWAVGLRSGGACQYQTLAMWTDSTTWTVVPTADVPGTNSVLADVDGWAIDDVWAVGATSCPGQPGRTLVERWTGRVWRRWIAPSPGSFSTLSGVDARSADDAWAVGCRLVGSRALPLIEHWDGSAWSLVVPPDGAVGELADAAIRAADDVWAVGSMASGGSDAPIAMHWDGSGWSSVPVPTPGGTAGFLADVALDGDGAFVAVGGWRPGGGDLRPLALRWDGAAWRAVRLPDLGSFASLRAVNGRWAVGSAVDDVASHPVVLRVDGLRWRTVAPYPEPPGSFPMGVADAAGTVRVVDGNRLATGLP